MTGPGAGFILLFLLLYHSRTCHCNYAHILLGQCYAFCLTKHESRLYRVEAEDSVNHGVTVRKCRKDKVCKSCSHFCESLRHDEYQEKDSCSFYCQKTGAKDRHMTQQACNDSCSFIKRSYPVKFGSCPQIGGDPGSDGHSNNNKTGDSDNNQDCKKNMCEEDYECDTMFRCCTSSCGKICLRIVEWKYLPPVPKSLEFHTRLDGSTMAKWNRTTPEQSTKPVLYVLRWWCPHSVVNAALTSKRRLRLKGYDYPGGLEPGQTCQFMLAAVNQFGSQGFSDVQQFTKKFVRPTNPGNLEVVRRKLRNDKMDVTIQWQPPLYTDNMPISRYLIKYYVDKISPSDAVSKYEKRRLRKMHNETVDGDKTSYTISGLEPSKTYFLQVAAVVNWKRRSFKGEPISTFIDKISIPEAVAPVDSDYNGEDHANSAIYNISVSKAAFLQSQLTARVTWNVHSDMDVAKCMIYWVPDVCDGEAQHRKTQDRLENEATTHKNEFLLYNLFSNCLYELRIHAVNSLGEIDEGHREVFRIQPCMDIQGARPELCFVTVPPPPLTPVDLSIQLKTSPGCACQAVISWRQAENPEEIHQHHHHHHGPRLPLHNDVGFITEWNVVWGHSRPPAGSDMLGSRSSTGFQAATIVYNTSPYETQVPGKETKACLTYLESSKHYTVKITGQLGDTKGEPAVFNFVTPDHMPICYTDFDDQFEGNSEVTTTNVPELSSIEAVANSGNNGGCASSYFWKVDHVQLFLSTVMTVTIFFICK